MKKYSVRVYLHTFVDFEVDADNEKEAVEIADNMEYDMNQLLDNLVPDDSEDVEEIKTTTYWYCETDSTGQRTGVVKPIDLPDYAVKTDEGGLKWYYPPMGRTFLYSSIEQAVKSALN